MGGAADGGGGGGAGRRGTYGSAAGPGWRGGVGVGVRGVLAGRCVRRGFIDSVEWRDKGPFDFHPLLPPPQPPNQQGVHAFLPLLADRLAPPPVAPTATAPLASPTDAAAMAGVACGGLLAMDAHVSDNYRRLTGLWKVGWLRFAVCGDDYRSPSIYAINHSTHPGADPPGRRAQGGPHRRLLFPVALRRHRRADPAVGVRGGGPGRDGTGGGVTGR